MASRFIHAIFAVGPALPGIAGAQAMERHYTIDVDARGAGPALLAAQLPPEERRQAQRVFEHVLSGNTRAVKAAARRYLVDHLAMNVGDVELTPTSLRWSRGRPTGRLARLAGPGRPASAEPAAPAEPPGPTPAALTASGKRIEMVGFSSDVSYGWDGSLSYEFDPVVLLRSGEAIRDAAAIVDPKGLDAHRRANPKRWTRWRRLGNTIETLDRGTWKKLGSIEHMQRPLPRTTRLGETFIRQRGGSAPGFAALTWSEMTFDRAGRFSTKGGAGSISSNDGGGSVSSSSRRAPGRGTYAIEGFVLTLRHDDGRVEYRSIVTHPKDGRAVWIDGAAHTGGD